MVETGRHRRTEPTPTEAEPAAVAAACDSVSRVYRNGRQSVPALAEIDKVFLRGSITAIVGPSGSGKSTLLRLLAGVDRPTAGRVSVNATPLSSLGSRRRRDLRRRHIAYVFQDPADNLVEYLDAIEQLELAARLRGHRFVPDEAQALLERLQLGHRHAHRPDVLSGGEQQRLAVACAVIGRPALVIADEPTAELDSTSTALVLDAMAELRSEGVAFAVSSHDHQVRERADHLLSLEHGRTAESW